MGLAKALALLSLFCTSPVLAETVHQPEMRVQDAKKAVEEFERSYEAARKESEQRERARDKEDEERLNKILDREDIERRAKEEAALKKAAEIEEFLRNREALEAVQLRRMEADEAVAAKRRSLFDRVLIGAVLLAIASAVAWYRGNAKRD